MTFAMFVSLVLSLALLAFLAVFFYRENKHIKEVSKEREEKFDRESKDFLEKNEEVSN